jgi:hypothetical protein
VSLAFSCRQILNRTGTDDHVELLVREPRRALRDDLNLDLAQRVDEPVPTFAQQALELAVAEVQTFAKNSRLVRMHDLSHAYSVFDCVSELFINLDG